MTTQHIALTRKKILEVLAPVISNEWDAKYLEVSLDRFIQTLKLVPAKCMKILDAGSGPGHLAILLKILYDFDVSCIDVNADYACKLNNLGINFEVCDLNSDKIPFPDESFDLVLFCEVLEHLLNPLNALREIRRVLIKNGVLILTTPKRGGTSPVWRLTFKLSRLRHGFSDLEMRNRVPFGKFMRHIKEYSFSECVKLLLANGFHILEAYLSNCVERRYYQKLYGDYDWKTPLRKLMLFLNAGLPLQGLIMIKAVKIE